MEAHGSFHKGGSAGVEVYSAGAVDRRFESNAIGGRETWHRVERGSPRSPKDRSVRPVYR